MIELTKDNVVSYVHKRLPFFNIDGEIRVSAIGEGTLEEDGDGFINFIFRVSDGRYHLIVKQTRADAKADIQIELDTQRFRLEYDTLRIRGAIAPDLVPKVYDCDDENHVLITEDVSRLSIARFQLVKGVRFPHLAEQMGRYMASTEFYTSEYYLESEVFRKLTVRFMNPVMRKIMDNLMFLSSVTPEDTVGVPLDPEFETFSRRVCADPEVRLARQELRHIFMTHAETLIHGDLHTSNVFAGPDDCKVIDMEYTFAGPFAYDLGYFLANFFAQYAAATFRPFETEQERMTYKAYCLYMIRQTYLSFCDEFLRYWDEDAKPEYQGVEGLQELFRVDTLRQMIGFAASAQLARISSPVNYPDYDEIEDYVQKHNAKCFSIIMNRQMLVGWKKYNTIDELIDDFIAIEEIYCRNIKDF